MKKSAMAALMVLLVAGPSFAKTHKENYTVPCATL
jgi:hypothetical protein